RMRGGFPRGNALRYVQEKHDVNRLLCMCAIDRATLSALAEYWVPECDVGGIHELLANALIMEGEGERTEDLRGEPLPGQEDAEDAEE
ncbi:(Fe-S)-binding protein, partial [Thermodesulfobacteriota bacterium]